MKHEMAKLCLDAQARAQMYHFLSAVYLRPLGQDAIRHLMDPGMLDQLASLFGGPAVAALKAFTSNARVDQDLETLRQEYMALFAVPTGRYVTPFEDVYQGKTADGSQISGPLLGDRAVAVKRMYRAAGAEMERACMELPTHIGVELSFMSFLCEREAAAMGDNGRQALPEDEMDDTTEFTRYREFQIRFLQEHLNAWFPQLGKSIQAKAKSPLYRGLAEITAAFLAQDTRELLAHPVSAGLAEH